MLKLIGPTTAWLRHVATAAAAVVAVIGVLAGLSPDEQTRLLGAVRQLVDGATNVVAALGTIVAIGSAVWARWTAQPRQQVAAVNALPNATVVPLDPSIPLTARPEPPATLSSHWLVAGAAFVLLWLLGACATAPDGSLDRRKTAANVEAGFMLVEGVAALYLALPSCGSDRATSVCADPAIAGQISKAVTVADAAVAEAVRNILAAPDQPAVTQWVSRALSAIAVLQTALRTYGVSERPG